MKVQAQIRRPGPAPTPRGDEGPSQAKIPAARTAYNRRARVRGLPGRSRMEEVEAA